MCGIAGFQSDREDEDPARLRRIGERMTEAVRERGPDGAGHWVDPDARVFLGHRRLSIQDPSELGAQPMHSACGRYVLVFNGEIYDFKPLGQALEARGRRLRGGSDSEVLLETIAEFGFEATLERIDGMFAFAVYDRRERCLLLARDPLGKKPLYYTWRSRGADGSPGVFAFGSKLAALVAHPELDFEIDRDALSRYLQVGWIPSPSTIYRDVWKLPPGHAMRVPLGRAPSAAWAYWSAAEVALRGERAPFEGDFDAACDAVEAALRTAVERRLVADVEVAALLSGGVDSSLVVGYAQQALSRRLRTYSIGFEEAGFDETPFAAEVAQHFGTRHEALIVRPSDVLERLPDLVHVYDEPMADPSGLPTLVLSHLVGRDVKVALSGDGGDEVFAGYPRQVKLVERWNALRRVPRWLRVALESAQHGLDGAASAAAHALAKDAGPLPAWLRTASFKPRPLGARDLDEYYLRSHERFRSGDGLVLGATRTLPLVTPDQPSTELRGDLARVLYLDALAFLGDDILVKVDRASMRAGLEVRSPLLDTRLLGLAWSLPEAHRIDDAGGGKRVLRALLARELPRSLVDRPKQGFNMPIAQWLQGPLRPMVDDLLDDAALRSQGLFDPAPIRRAWREHVSGWRSHRNLIWSLVVFQLWHESFHAGVQADQAA